MFYSPSTRKGTLNGFKSFLKDHYFLCTYDFTRFLENVFMKIDKISCENYGSWHKVRIATLEKYWSQPNCIVVHLKVTNKIESLISI